MLCLIFVWLMAFGLEDVDMTLMTHDEKSMRFPG